MKKGIMLLLMVMTFVAASAQQTDLDYFDAIKVINGDMTSKNIISRGYTTIKEAQGASFDTYYIKGDAQPDESMSWRSKSGNGSIVVVSRDAADTTAITSVNVLYANISGIQKVADELGFSRATTSGKSEDDTFHVFHFTTDDFRVDVRIPKLSATMSELHVERR